MSAEHELTEVRCALHDTVELLKAARCPDVDCTNGVVAVLPWGRIGGDVEIHQCQWCHERVKMVAEHG